MNIDLCTYCAGCSQQNRKKCKGRKKCQVCPKEGYNNVTTQAKILQHSTSLEGLS